MTKNEMGSRKASAEAASGQLTESLEDYLEVIYHVFEERRTVRPKDIIARKRVRGASVTGALRALAKRGLIYYTPYDAVMLTPKGMDTAKDVIRRHELLQAFLTRILGVEQKAADIEACRLEHAVSRFVLNRLVKLARFLENCPRAALASVPEMVVDSRSGEPCPKCGRDAIWNAGIDGGDDDES